MSDAVIPDNTTPTQSAWGSLFEILKTAGFVLIFAFVIRQFLVQPFVIDGASMEPNFHDSEYIVVDKLSYRVSQPQRGEVVVFHPPFREDNFIKRVIGLPGDTVEVRGHQILINNEPLPENYTNGTASTFTDSQAEPSIIRELAEDEYYVLGDNRDHSKDSRELGPIPRSRIIGRAWLVLFPLNNLAIIHLPDYPTQFVKNSKQALVQQTTRINL